MQIAEWVYTKKNFNLTFQIFKFTFVYYQKL